MSHVVTTRLDAETLDMVDRAARAMGRSRAWFAARAIRRMAEEEVEFLASIVEAEAQIDRGECYSQEDVEAWFEARVAGRIGKE